MKKNNKNFKNGNKRKQNKNKKGENFEQRGSKRPDSNNVRDRMGNDFSGEANDPAYYNGDPELITLSANIPTLHIEGTPISTEFDIDQDTNCVYGNQDRPEFMAPSICAIKYIPTLGQSTDKTSAINRAFDMTYNMARKYDSSLAAYDAANLALYAGSAIYAHLAVRFAIKVFKSMITYQRFNWATPNLLIQSLGGNPSGFNIKRLAEFQSWLKVKCAEVNRVFFPIAFPAVDRMTSVVDMSLRDDNADRAQYYTFVPQGFFYFDMTTEPWSLNFKKVPAYFTMDDLMDYVDEIIIALYSNPDMNLISAGLMKAFKVTITDMLYTDFEPTPIDFKYDPRMLLQINNAVAHGSVDSIMDLRYTENTDEGGIRFNPTFSGLYANRLNTSGWVLNMNEDTTPLNISYATRLLTNIKLDALGNGVLTSFGTEILTGFTIYYNEDGEKPAFGVSWTTQTNIDVDDITPQRLTFLMQLREATSMFDYAPKYSVAIVGNDNTDTVIYPESRNLRNYFFVEQRVLDNITYVTTLNLWDGTKMLDFFLAKGSSSST